MPKDEDKSAARKAARSAAGFKKAAKGDIAANTLPDELGFADLVQAQNEIGFYILKNVAKYDDLVAAIAEQAQLPRTERPRDDMVCCFKVQDGQALVGYPMAARITKAGDLTPLEIIGLGIPPQHYDVALQEQGLTRGSDIILVTLDPINHRLYDVNPELPAPRMQLKNHGFRIH
jgi:hypothetical protein